MSGATYLPALRGGLLALLAAVLFGVSTPVVQRLGVGLGAFTTAALLYAGATLVGALSLRSAAHEARLQRSDVPCLLAMAGFGAALGPVALAWCIDPAVSAQVRLLKHKPQRGSSCPAPGVGAGGCKS